MIQIREFPKKIAPMIRVLIYVHFDEFQGKLRWSDNYHDKLKFEFFQEQNNLFEHIFNHK